ncbi:MAG: ABC transporter substrate-binding protein [Deltaproteobacteria bacterium]|nr:ABC transporter substrate-binding protein [Deltaproteobacteria bacterium]
MRTFAVTVSGLALLFVFLAVSSVTAENVKIGIPSLTVTMMPLAVAKERGYFQQEGLNVELILMPAALNIKVLLSGGLDYATTIGSAVVAAVRGIDVRVVMCFVDRALFDLVGTREINSVADLKGRLVGISSRGGVIDVATRQMIKQSGVDPAQVTLLIVGGQTEMLVALKTGRISAGLLSPPQNFLAYREGLKNLGFAGAYIRIPSTGVVAMRDQLERNPDQVRRVLRALSRARVFARENKSAVLPILGRFLKLEDERLLSELYDYHQRAETPDGRIDTGLAAQTIRDFRQAEGVAREIPVGQLFDFSYLEPHR